jgi:hypothetical protein
VSTPGIQPGIAGGRVERDRFLRQTAHGIGIDRFTFAKREVIAASARGSE